MLWFIRTNVLSHLTFTYIKCATLWSTHTLSTVHNKHTRMDRQRQWNVNGPPNINKRWCRQTTVNNKPTWYVWMRKKWCNQYKYFFRQIYIKFKKKISETREKDSSYASIHRHNINEFVYVYWCMFVCVCYAASMRVFYIYMYGALPLHILKRNNKC